MGNGPWLAWSWGLLLFNAWLAGAAVPGTVIHHSPAASGLYLGSPSLAALSTNHYLVSHDEFGPGSSEHHQGMTSLFESRDRGRSWHRLTRLAGAYWSTLFTHRGALYLLGTDRHNGRVVIRRSDDGGLHWTTPDGPHRGMLRDDGHFHCAPVPVLEHGGRLWRAMEQRNPAGQPGGPLLAGMMSVPAQADLLESASWTWSRFLPSDPRGNGGDFHAWLEGNAVAGPDGQVWNILRVQTKALPEKAALVRISPDGRNAEFRPADDLINFPGGAKKFTIRYDLASRQFWSLASVAPELRQSEEPGRIRNTLALTSSPDLRQWTVKRRLLHHPDPVRHGFQYVDWLLEGDDIIAACRMAYDDDQGGAHDNRDANYLTFHRFANFRSAP